MCWCRFLRPGAGVGVWPGRGHDRNGGGRMATKRITHPGVDERKARGLEARELTPVSSHIGWRPATDRADPVGLLEKQNATREPDLVPVRHGRMMVSPFTFYRGTAKIMAADLKDTPVAGLTVQLCGDAHLSNFGVFASPERRLVFDLNDFDETYPGPFEWDVKRLLASVALAGRANGFRRRDRAEIIGAAAGRYREAMAGFAAHGELDVWYARADIDDLTRRLDKVPRRYVDRIAAQARSRTSLQAYRKMTTVVDGRRRIVADPPLLVPVADLLPQVDRVELEEQIRTLLS